jgi:hypothetical protein
MMIIALFNRTNLNKTDRHDITEILLKSGIKHHKLSTPEVRLVLLKRAIIII